MSFKPFKWVKNHPWETAAIAATAGFGGAGLAGVGPLAGLFGAGEAAATVAPLVGGAGELGGAAAFAPEIASALPYTLGSQAALFSAPEVAAPLTMGAAPFAQGAVTAAPGMSAAYGPAANNASSWLSRMDPKKVMGLGMMAAQMGTPQQGGPQGAQFEPPAMRSALHSQAEITKAWLQKNDPKTYARMYGNPQGVA